MSVINLRKSQSKAFTELRQHDHAILNAPTGWGKSMVLCALAGDELLSDKERKVVIAIPQTVIAKGFIHDVSIKLPTDEILDWTIKHNLCDFIRNKTEELSLFLTEPAINEKIFNRIIVTTHAGLARTFASLSDKQLAEASKNTTFIIDEAHHISGADESCNQLGAIVNYILDDRNPTTTTRLILATAFFFRGDKLPIIRENHLDRFYRHSILFDEYWRSLKYIKSYKYDFVAFKGTVWKSLNQLLAQDQSPTIIYCPPKSHRLLLGKEKSDFTKRIVRTVKKHYPDSDLWSADGDNEGRIILDLVDGDNRDEKIKFAMTQGEQIDAILTVGMFKEGADWLQAQRVIDLVPSGSDQDRNQRFGRLIRDYPGKKHISYFSFFPVVTDAPKDEQRKYLSKLFAHFHASLILDNALNPIKMPKYYDDGHFEGGSQGRPVNLLGQYDEDLQESILSDCYDAMTSLFSDCEQQNRKPSDAEAQNAIVRALNNYDIEQEEQTAKQIVLMIRRKANINLAVDDLVHSGFDKVWSDDTLKGLQLFSAGFGGPTRFAELRKIISGIFDSNWLENYEKIKSLPACPPQSSKAYWWISNNKAFYRDGRLSKERIHLLESIPWWEWFKKYDDRWQEYFNEIKAYKHHPTKLPKALENWTGKQRLIYSAGKLSQDRIELLESISWWQWKPDRWHRNYKSVRVLKERPFPKTDKKSTNWFYQQRVAYHRGNLSVEKINLLEAIIWWSWA